jgi:cytochrome P450
MVTARDTPTLPGPRSRGPFGNMIDFESDPLGYLRRTSARHGDIWALNRQKVVVAGADQALEVLGSPPDLFLPNGGLDAIFVSPVLGTGPKVEQRRASARDARVRGMRPAVIGRGLPSLAHACDQALAEWPDETTLDVIDAARGIGAHLGAVMALGEDADLMEGRHRPMAQALLHMFGRTVKFPRWFPDPVDRRYRRHLRRVDAAMATIVERRCPAAGGAGEDGARVRGVGDVLAETMRAAERYADLLDNRILGRIITANLLAMQGSPAIGLTWVLHLLAAHPDIQDRVRAEAEDAAASSAPATTLGRPLAVAVAKEALRLYPPSWVLERTVLQHTKLDGHALGPGTKLLVSPYVIHRDPRWFDDPDEFQPDRWLADKTQADPRAFIAFGSGDLSCKGVTWVMAQTVTATAAIVRRWRLSPAPGQEGYRLRALGDLQPVGLRLRLSPLS